MLFTVVLLGSQTLADGSTKLPLLTLLIVSEFSFIVSAIGVYIGTRHLIASGFQARYALATLLCAALVVRFGLFGIQLWPSTAL